MHSLAFTQPTFSSRPHMPLLFYSFPCFLPTTATLPPPSRPTTSSSPRFTLSLVHARCPLHPSYAARFFTTGSQPRARARATKRRRSRSPASAFAPGRASNLIIRRLIIREKGTRITRVQLFSPESFRSPFIGDLIRRSIACRARICADLTRARG